jgi:hypothetical protein
MALSPCPECKHEISSAAPSCPHCGFVRRPEPRATSRGTRWFGKIVLIFFAGTIGLAILSVVSAPKPADSKAGATEPASLLENSPNSPNAYLLTLSQEDQAAQLGKVIGGGCKGRRPFYKGIGKSGFGKDKAFWNVECANDQSYQIEVDPDGHTGVLECAVLQKVGAGRCFQKFAD